MLLTTESAFKELFVRMHLQFPSTDNDWGVELPIRFDLNLHFRLSHPADHHLWVGKHFPNSGTALLIKTAEEKFMMTCSSLILVLYL
jgi:hypothetical protein